MTEELITKLESYFQEMKDWERKPILKSGKIVIELVKLPEKKSKSTYKPPRLAIMIRKEDAFRGMLIESPDEIEDLIVALSLDKVKELANAVKQVNKKRSIAEFEI
ncbi:MAG: hypothetical protein J7L82_05305 [Staphylothermus sp.]|nr:hypothetical protein [Staphylothermus sp.]